MNNLISEVLLARMIAHNGVDFLEGVGAHVGVWVGFMPHKDGCKVSSVVIQDFEGNLAPTPTWVGTTLDLDSYISAGLVVGGTGINKAYITSITFSSGGATALKDELRNS
jgi:hypothetical protein